MLIKKTEGRVNLPDSLVTAVRREAHLAADLAITFLEAGGAPNRAGDRSIQWPIEFMLELGAALRIVQWWKAGLLEGLKTLSLGEALAHFIQRGQQEDQWRIGPDAAPLTRLVLKEWKENFAWSAQQDVGTDCLLQRQEEELSDREIEEIARTLWELRHHQPESRNERECG